MTRVKPKPLLLVFVAACTSCTTLENRRDLYRSPEEGYEEWYPHPPPTRLPSTMPGNATTSTTMTTRMEHHGVLTFPEEPLRIGLDSPLLNCARSTFGKTEKLANSATASARA